MGTGEARSYVSFSLAAGLLLAVGLWAAEDKEQPQKQTGPQPRVAIDKSAL